MLSEQSLKRAQGVAGIHAPVHFFPQTESTNFTATRLADQGAPEWTLVATTRQTEGRGRLGRRWTTPEGGALMFSFVLRPRLDPERAGLLTLLVGAAAATACRDLAGLEVACKWPNDLLLDDRKVGGILTEARTSGGSMAFVVVGIGLNTQAPPSGMQGAGGLGGKVDEERLLGTFLHVLRRAYHPEDPQFGASVLEMYRPLSATLGELVRIPRRDGRIIEGLAADLDAWGALIVETDGSRKRVTSGEIIHVRPAGDGSRPGRGIADSDPS